MFGAPDAPAVAALEAVVIAAFLLVVGRLAISVLLGERLGGGHWPWTLAFAGICGLAVVAMVIHMATGGALFASPWATRIFVLTVALGLAIRSRQVRVRRGRAPTDRTTALLLWGVVILGALVWCSPVARMLPISYGGDTVTHSGWSSQLLNGEPVPSGPVPGDIPDYYPWLSHALIALIARLTPGGTAYHALGPLLLIQVCGGLLALFGLGQQLGKGRLAGCAATLFGGLAGGFGFLMVRGINVVLDPRTAGELYLGDLLFKRSYNSAFFNIAPTYPRDIAFALVISFLLLLIGGLRQKSSALLVGAGVALGMAGLTGAESLFVGFGALLMLLLIGPTGLTRRRLATAVVMPAVGVYALWLGPQVYNYLRLGGYVNLTMVDNVTLSPAAVLVSWGISLPFAVWGIVRWLRPHLGATQQRVVASLLLCATVLLVGSSILPGVFGGAFETIGRPHRYWPHVHLGLVLCAVGGAEDVARRLWGRRRLLIGVSAATLLVALPSPTIASLALPEVRRPWPVLVAAATGSEDAMLNLVLRSPGQRCIVAAPVKFGQAVWSYTGYRVLMFVWPLREHGNLARIRWRDIYETVASDTERREAQRTLMEGPTGAAEWNAVIDRYGIDTVVIEPWRVEENAGSARLVSDASDVDYSVIRTGDCE